MIAKKIGDTLYRRAYGRVRNGAQLAELARDPHPVGQRLSDAVAAVLANSFEPAERAAFDRVEELRASLQASRDEIGVLDYGAGESTETRSAEEMARGRSVTTTVGAICRNASKPPRWARLLFSIVREVKPQRCVELGTSLGLSAAYQASALQLNGSGRLDTLEGAPEVAERARAHLAGLSLPAEVTTGRFQDTLPPLLEHGSPIDYAFVDGHHDHDATLAYFEQLMPWLNDDAILVFDDVAWSPGMAAAWRRIREDERVGVAVDLFKVGVCAVRTTGGGGHPTYRIALD